MVSDNWGPPIILVGEDNNRAMSSSRGYRFDFVLANNDGIIISSGDAFVAIKLTLHIM